MATLTITGTAALLLLLAAASYAEAASIRTTVIIDEVDNQGRWSGREQPGSCWSQLQRQGNLRRCQDYMAQEAQRGGSGWRRGSGPGGRRVDPQSDPFTACCSALRRMDTQCTCMGIESAIGEMFEQQRGQLQGQSAQAAWRIAQSLPGECGVSSPARCQFKGQPGGRYYAAF